MSENNFNNYKMTPEQDNLSSATLVLGISSLALTLMFCCCGGGGVSVVCGIIALALGIPRLIKNPHDMQAKIGVILAGVGLFLSLCAIVLGIVMYINGALTDLLYDMNSNWI